MSHYYVVKKGASSLVVEFPSPCPVRLCLRCSIVQLFHLVTLGGIGKWKRKNENYSVFSGTGPGVKSEPIFPACQGSVQLPRLRRNSYNARWTPRTWSSCTPRASPPGSYTFPSTNCQHKIKTRRWGARGGRGGKIEEYLRHRFAFCSTIFFQVFVPRFCNTDAKQKRRRKDS